METNFISFKFNERSPLRREEEWKKERGSKVEEKSMEKHRKNGIKRK